MKIAEIVNALIMYLKCSFELFLLYIFLKETFPARKRPKCIQLMEAMVCVTVMFSVNGLNNFTVNLICVPLIYMIFTGLLFRTKLKYSVLYVTFYYVILAVSEFVFYYLYVLLNVDIGAVSFSRVALLIIQDAFRFIVIKIVNSQHQSNHQSNHQSGNYKYLRNLFLLPATALILLNGFNLIEQYPIGYILICFGGIMLIVDSVVDFSIVEKLIEAVNAVNDAKMFAMKLHMEQEHYRRLEELNQDYARYMHEMRHMMRIIGQLASTEDNNAIKSLASEIAKIGLPEKKRYYAGDQITNAIFVEREKKALELGIEYKVSIAPGMDFSFISDMDKITMFGNLLDNALEAASVCDKGYVHASLRMGNEALMVFEVENNFRNKTKKSGREYLTIKSEKWQHGFGIKSVERLAGKYAGMLSITENDNIFNAVLILSSMQKVEQ